MINAQNVSCRCGYAIKNIIAMTTNRVVATGLVFIITDPNLLNYVYRLSPYNVVTSSVTDFHKLQTVKVDLECAFVAIFLRAPKSAHLQRGPQNTRMESIMDHLDASE